MRKNTTRLLNELKNAKSFVGFVDKNTDAFSDESISDYLQRLCFERNVELAQVIRRSESTGHTVTSFSTAAGRPRVTS